MADLLIFDKDDKLLAVLSNEAEGACSFWSAPFTEVLNGGSSFEFSAFADHEDAKHIVAENQVAFLDKDDVFRLFTIKEPERTNGGDRPQIRAVCEPAMLELNDEIIEDLRPYNTTAKDALTRVLTNTRWKVGTVTELGLNSTNFYYVTATKSVYGITDVWGGEIRDRIEISNNKITGRYIDILARRGADTGKIWEIDKDILSISHKVQSYPKTALFGRGASLETDSGGYTRKIDFADVVWSKANGDPVDKPAGQKWIGDPGALNVFGRLNANGTRRHRFGVYENSDQEDPAKLLRETWEALQIEKAPIEQYSMDVFLLERISGYEHEKVRLGDTTIGIDRTFSKPIEIEERVIEFEYDVADPNNSGHVELGRYIDLYSDEERLANLESKLNDKAAIWDKGGDGTAFVVIINDDSFENITPQKVYNVTATGMFNNIMVKWEYTETVLIAHYEVYASQIAGFTPDVSNMVYRGKTNGYTHEAVSNQQWYFKVRAVNTHGVAGPFSDEAMAQTTRIISDDILFGPEIATELRELSKTANLLADNTITIELLAQSTLDTIAYDYKQYTNQQVGAMETTLMSELADKADLQYVNDELYLIDQTLLDKVDNTTFSNKTGQIDASIEGLQTSYSTLSGTVDSISGRVNTVELNYSTLKQDAEGLSSEVGTLTANFNNMKIGDGNLLFNSTWNLGEVGWSSSFNSTYQILEPESDKPNSKILKITAASNTSQKPSDAFYIEPGEEYTVSFDVKTEALTTNSLLFTLRAYPEKDTSTSQSSSVWYQSIAWFNQLTDHTKWQRVTYTFKPTAGNWLRVIPYNQATGQAAYFREIKVTKGNKETGGWVPSHLDAESRISSAVTMIEQNSKQIELRATTTEVNALTGRMSTAEGQITTMAGNIDLKVSKDGVISAINLSPENIKINTHLLNVGDFTNLIDNGTFEDDATNAFPKGWTLYANRGDVMVYDQSTWGSQNGSAKTLAIWAGNGYNTDVLQSRFIQVSEGDQLYFEMDYRTHNTAGTGLMKFGTRNYNAKKEPHSWGTAISTSTKGAIWTKLTGTYTIPAGVGFIQLRVTFENNGETTNRFYADNLVVRRKNNSLLLVDGAIMANHMAANSITAANAAIANAAITRANLQDAIIGTAQIEDGVITNAKIKDLNADKINAGAIRGIDIYGSKFRSSAGTDSMHIVGGNIHLDQNGGRSLDIGPDGIYGYNSGGTIRFQADSALVTSSAFGTSNQNVYLAAEVNGEARVVDYASIPADGSIYSYRYLPIRTSGIYGNFWNINPAVGENAVNLYARPLSGGELRITRNGTTDTYENLRAAGIYANAVNLNEFHGASTHLYLRVGSSGEIRATGLGTIDAYRPIRASGFYGTHIDTSGTSEAVHFYVRPAGGTGEARITVRGTTDTYRPIRASEFLPPSSSRETKKNIELFSGNVLDSFRNMNVYKFNYKFEEDDHKQRLGVMLDESPVEITAHSNDTVDFYSMIGYAFKGIIDVIAETDSTKDDVNWLKLELQYARMEIKEQKALIDSLTTRIEALEKTA